MQVSCSKDGICQSDLGRSSTTAVTPVNVPPNMTLVTSDVMPQFVTIKQGTR